MICTCCGQWRVETIVISVPRYGARQRLRITNGRHYVGDFANPHEVAAVLAQNGVLDRMTEVEKPC
ncbi:hypothetical protein [Catelliglobosispora koreensis]|uniref:hypothetical protein n=1 Tax=Catelliglobosispora koreensis TaxID=129052 RepID=UPI001FE0E194|nr:hypothetical protein [Catelliglobosispora koreensis]